MRHPPIQHLPIDKAAWPEPLKGDFFIFETLSGAFSMVVADHPEDHGRYWMIPARLNVQPAPTLH